MKKRTIYISTVLLTAVTLIFIITQAVNAARWEQKVDDLVLATAVAEDDVEFLVYLNEQADLSGAARLPTKEAKGQYVYEQLTAVAERTQPPLLKTLDAQGAAYRRFWVANMIWVRGDRQVLQTMAQATAVAHIYANPAIQLDILPPVDAHNRPDQVDSIEKNISHVNAPAVWALGYTGQGIVIGGQDTGYQWDHPALINTYRGWNGVAADHNYNWHDAIHTSGSICDYDLAEPCDDNNHGTHTMGTMVGDDGGSNQIGMAPDAEWISCRNMKAGWGTPATYTECYEWFIAPYPYGGNPLTDGDPTKAPHVINNSWACPPEEGCSWDTLQSVVQAVRAAGIVTVHSAGNKGPSCSTVVDPAAIYAESFSVAATTSDDAVTSFSSRGPVTIDGSNRFKPDISAPGVGIRSSYKDNSYGTMGGTSMAAPHVAGLVALLLSARPDLIGDVAGIEALIKTTAVPLYTTQGCGDDTATSLPNHVFGWGRIDALAMIENTLAYTLTIGTDAPSIVDAGQSITYTFTVTNQHILQPAHNVILTNTLPVATTWVTATMPFTQTGNRLTWSWPELPPNGSQTVQLVVQVDITATEPIINWDYGVKSDEVTAVTGPPLITTINYQVYMPIIIRE